MQAAFFFLILTHVSLTCNDSYGPGQEGIERVDLLVGDMYERKVQPSFALSETSFIVFLLMASRRLDSDPFLNELYNEETYTKFGFKHVKKTKGLIELLERHYPDMTEDFKDKKGKFKQSAFKPTLTAADWEKAIEDKVVPEKYTKEWAATKTRNKEFFEELEKETEIFTKNLTANAKEIPVFNPDSIWTIIAVLLVIVPYYLMNTTVVPEINITPMFPADSINIAKEFAYSNVRHNDALNKVSNTTSKIVCLTCLNPMLSHHRSIFLDSTPLYKPTDFCFSVLPSRPDSCYIWPNLQFFWKDVQSEWMSILLLVYCCLCLSS